MSDLRTAKLNYSENCAREEFAGPVSDYATRKLKFGSTSKSHDRNQIITPPQCAATKLEALAANPEVWSKTVFFYMFDENDGFFDHTVPPAPPQPAA
jgi:hypothetical protein